MERRQERVTTRRRSEARDEGLGLVIPFSNALSFAIGAAITEVWTRLKPRNADTFNVPIASGLIAGESLIAAFIAILCTLVGLIWRG